MARKKRGQRKAPQPRPQYNAEAPVQRGSSRQDGAFQGSRGADKGVWRLGRGWTMRKLIEKKG